MRARRQLMLIATATMASAASLAGAAATMLLTPVVQSAASLAAR